MSLLTPKTIVITTSLAGKQPCRPVAFAADMDDDEEPKKRRRLTHLSPEEKMLRRKLKNRVAAQTARDRKKALMSDLEIKIAELEAENKKLLNENKHLKVNTSTLISENSALKERLGQMAPPSGGLCGGVDETVPLRSAAPADPLPKEQIQSLLHYLTAHYAVFSLTIRCSDVLLGLLEQLNEESSKLESKAKTGEALSLPVSAVGAATPNRSVVGPSSAELESLNELIKFDHIYYKAEPSEKGAAKSSVLSQADSSVKQTSLLTGQTSLQTVQKTGQTELVAQGTEVPVSVEDNLEMQVDVPTISIDDSTGLDDVTNLQLLDDIESLLQCEDLLSVVEANSQSVSQSVSLTLDNKCSQTRGQKRKLSSTSSSKAESLTVDDHLQGYFSDSGVSGDLSDVPSPASDISGGLSDDSWEESFTELFPDLL